MLVHFTPISAAVGGALIGTATVAYRYFAGRYAGISGIARGVVFGSPERDLDLLFIVGLLAGGAIWFWLAGHGRNAPAGAPLMLVGLGGILVGVGTTLGRGCTSGHGVCGLARFSASSLTAVLSFVLAGMAIVFVVRSVLHV